MINPLKKSKILIVGLKWTDYRPDRPLCSTFQLVDTLKQSGLGEPITFFCDEHIYKKQTQCDEAFLRCCLQHRPDFMVLFPTQLDITMQLKLSNSQEIKHFYLFPRNETIAYARSKLGIPVINSVGDAWGKDAFDRFESMKSFSDKILLFDPESDFLKMTQTPDKYAVLWFPINQQRYYRNGCEQDIPLSFIGRTHVQLDHETIPISHPLHQYVYRNRFLQYLLSVGYPVFRAGGAQNVYPLPDDMVAQYIRRSKISLNFTYNTPNKKLFRGRAWETLNCGSMLLEEDNPSIRHYLEPMKHYVPFSDMQDAIDKIDYYMAHENERKEIVESGHSIVREKYSDRAFWSHCIKHALC